MATTAIHWTALKGFCIRRWAEPDKRQHFWVSAHLTLAGLWLYPPEVAYGGIFLVGLLKEIWDHFLGSGFCRLDILANGLGIGFVAILCEIFAAIARSVAA